MGLLEQFKDVADLVKKAGDIQLYRQITALEGEVIDLTRANRQLEAQNEELKLKMAARATMQFKSPFWYVEGDDVPYCPKCWEAATIQVHLQGPVSVAAGTRYDCLNCKNLFIKERKDPEPPAPPYGPKSTWG